MPSRSKAQAKFMQAVAHGMKPRGGGPSQQQAREFANADKRSGVSNLPTRKGTAAKPPRRDLPQTQTQTQTQTQAQSQPQPKQPPQAPQAPQAQQIAGAVMNNRPKEYL